MRWLPSLRESKGMMEDSTRRATSSGYNWSGTPYHGNWNVDRAVRDGYERVIWVFAAVNHIASSASRLPIQLREGDEGGPLALGAMQSDPLMRLLNRHANAWETAANFRFRLVAQLLLSKKGVFVEVVRSRLGAPLALHLLPCGYTSPVPDPKRYVSEFEVITNGVPERIPAYEDDGVTPHVLWIRKPHPTDPYSGVTPMEAAGISVDTDFYARLYNKAFLQNDGRPGGVLGIKGEMDQDDKDEIKRRFGGGPSQAGRTTVVEAETLNWVDTAVTPRDAQYVEALSLTKTDILGAFGLDESLIGSVAGRTYENASQAQRNFWRETMPPWLDLIGGAFDRLTVGGIEDDLFCVHDTESVPILQLDRQTREKALKELFDAGLISADDFREETGRDPIGTRGTRSLWVQGTKRPMGDPSGPEDDLLAIPVVPQQQASVSGVGVKALGIGETKGLTNDSGTIHAAVDKRAATFTRTVKRYMERQERVVLERLGGVKARRGTPLWDPPGTKALDAGDLLDLERWDAELEDDLRPLVEDTYADEASAAGVDLDADVAEAAVLARLATAKLANQTTLSKLERAVDAQEGDTTDDVRGRVQGVYDEAKGSRSEAIGETEAAGSTNEARDLIAAVTGAKYKRWRSRADALVRESHKTAAQATKISVEQPFIVGGASLRYPGDPLAPIKETARCRCWTEFIQEDDG